MPVPVINSVAESAAEIAEWRHDIHRHPELGYAVERTAGVVADKLKDFGCDEVVTGIGHTGVVGVIRGRTAGPRTIALRADMDALPIVEATDVPYRSTTPGHMHACGHDGHVAMLLGAARHLCETRAFAGTAIVVFQPAEEGGAGAKAMLDDGLIDRFGIEEVYGMHNMPGIPVGRFALRTGPIMAATDRFEIRVDGRGGHAALPHLCLDPVLAGSQIVGALQSIASRNVDPLDSCVLSVTQFHAGSTVNVIPPTATLHGTIRTLKPETRDLAERRLHAVVDGVAAAAGLSATATLTRGYPVTINHPEATPRAARAAAEVSGGAAVDTSAAPIMGGEDFAFMLEARPGALVFLGNGDTAGLHHPGYDFNDAALPYGVSYWVRLAETILAI